ncbi:glycosyltransferase family 4 protein [Halostagnicola kamekurae]|uniref:Glycosyltransferase involved in cell wall bisynthesis n=1 Tax=Halostagnicola kamekurae TaxID=619731 RepID=A0A1I6PMG3_9EURY|nr:glycosyltransferase family 4 protein [Halostagnicola kamekurae]SFS41330.1 Glycosyltransferase involved in cell wall bisynthesis [Halostagnicola kamekurae]
MHVLLATNNLFPEPSATGSGRYNYEVGRRLVERGHDVSVVTRRRDSAPVRERVAGMDVWRYDASIPRLPMTLRTIDRCVASIDSAKPIDLASFHGALSSFGVDRALPDRIPRTYTLHGLWAVEYRERTDATSAWEAPWHRLNRKFRQRIEGRVMGNCETVIVLSEFMRKRLADFHPRVRSSTVIPGGVDVDRFAPRAGSDVDRVDQAASETDHFDPDACNFLTIRRLTPRMGLETLLDAFAEVHRENGDTHLYIGGSGPLRSELESRAVDRGIDSAVTFLGYVPDDRLAAAYAAADAFVLPTLELEGFGLATLEALSAGTPAIGTTAGATPEILEDLEDEPAVPESLLVPPGDADRMAALMSAWARVPPSERAAAGEASRSYVLESGYTWEAVTDRVERLFERISA